MTHRRHPARSALTHAVMATLMACATTPPPPDAPALDLPLAATCAHGYPVDECVHCHPEQAAAFKARGDWCAEHDLPESHCLKCHPALKFYVMPPLPPDADLVHLSRMGEDVGALEPHVAPGKVTIFDFYAQWCGPCKSIDALVLAELGKRSDLAYRKLNIYQWESALARHYLAEVSGLPYVVVFDKDGRRRGEARDAETLAQILKELP